MTITTPFKIPSYAVERSIKKRGRSRIFDRFDPHETALVVIDMQNYFLNEIDDGFLLIPTINRLTSAFRERGAAVAWVSMTAGRNGQSLWPLYHDYFFDEAGARRHREGLTEGAPGHALHSGLMTAPSDIFATKSRFSAFLPGKSDLHEKLTARGIVNVAIAGVVTSVCCETSARDAMMLDYRVAMISDANAARRAEDNVAAFTAIYQSFGDVVTSDEMLAEVLLASDRAELNGG